MKKALTKTLDGLELARKWWAIVVALIAGATWMMGWWSERALPIIDLPKSVADLSVKVDKAIEILDDQGRRVHSLELSVQQITPKKRVAEYDEFLSHVIGECRSGQMCTAQFRVRRTIYGQNCGAPHMTPVVVNHFGQRHLVEDFRAPRTKAMTDWTNIRVFFQPPSGALPGRAQFYLELDFPDCFGPDSEIVQSRSAALGFDLLKSE